MTAKTTNTAKSKPAKGTQAEGTPAKTKIPKTERGMSALDAAAKVLGEASEPMATKAMIEAMAAKKYWTSPGGKTPHATLYAAILREIKVKENESRFAKTDPGHFTLNGKAPTTRKSARKGKA
ncbi:MAG TPA: HTH domain-containing protein [Caulifigura sp.]|jgi:hypothetical protein|nr:HTH domain-containing protein [Caulifigura sp.]